MAWNVSFTARAERDLRILHENIHAAESVGAARWFATLEDTMALLSTAPRMGKVTQDDPAVRELIYGKKPHFYRVLYEISEDLQEVTVLTIRHGRQMPLPKP